MFMNRASLLVAQLALYVAAAQQLSPDSAFAQQSRGLGPSVSGGGMALVCNLGNPGSQEHVQVLDTAEAKDEYGAAALMKSSGDTRRDFVQLYVRYQALVLNNSKPPAAVASSVYAELIESVTWVSNEDLAITADADPTIDVHPACEIRQLAVYLDSGVTAGLYIGRELWDALDPLNQAVLLMHEYIYRWQRIQGATTSNSTRSLVGFLLTAKGLDALTTNDNY
jgi:hypothetical protein